MKKIITVRDVCDARKNLLRFERYAERNMADVAIAQANTNIAAARKLLSNNLREFDALDITTLTPDNTWTLERIERYTSYIAEIQSNIKQMEEERCHCTDEYERGSLTDDIDRARNDIVEYEDEITEMQREF